jgi:hypothetical protein
MNLLQVIFYSVTKPVVSDVDLFKPAVYVSSDFGVEIKIN